MTSGQVSVNGALAFAWALLRTHWRAVWGVLALSSLAQVVCVVGQLTARPGIGVIGLGGILITSLMANGALYRLALADRHAGDPEFVVGHQGLQWRRTEWRMLLASLLAGVFVAFLAFLACLVVLGVLAGVLQANGTPMRFSYKIDQLQTALGPAGFATFSCGVMAIVVLAVFLTTRLSLVLPATVDAKAVRVLQTWKSTRGRFWNIFTAILIVQFPISLITAQIGQALAGGAAGSGPAPAEAILTAALIMGAPAGAFILPLTAGVSAYFHRAGPASPQTPSLPASER